MDSKHTTEPVALAKVRTWIANLPTMPAAYLTGPQFANDCRDALEVLSAPTAPSEDGRDARLPKEPPPGLLMSMALRFDHGLGVPGYYDQPMFSLTHTSHAKRLEGTLSIMRQLYEEVSGHGFYSPERESDYAAMLSTNKD